METMSILNGTLSQDWVLYISLGRPPKSWDKDRRTLRLFQTDSSVVEHWFSRYGSVKTSKSDP